MTDWLERKERQREAQRVVAWLAFIALGLIYLVAALA